MPETNKTSPPRVFISAIEPSADLYGSLLMDECRRRRFDIDFVGLPGPRMEEAGCKRLFEFSEHAAMLLAAVMLAGKGFRLLRQCRRWFRTEPCAAAILIDSPTLHLPLARIAKKADVPVLYFVAPQLWAWGRWRIGKLRRRVDRLATVLPFEEEYFRSRGVDARFVGHPLADVWSRRPVDPTAAAAIRAQGSPVIALLPGSRRHVVREVLPGQLEVARRVSDHFPNALFGVSIANPSVAPEVDKLTLSFAPRVEKFLENHVGLLEAADLVLVASGTTTLEVAFHRKPMIVMYNSSRFFYHVIGRWLVTTPFLSLPNILANREIVPEFMPYYTSTEPIVQCALDILRSPERRGRMVQDLATIVAPLRSRSASQTVASMLAELIGK